MSLSKFITEIKARGIVVHMEGQTFRRVRVNPCDESFAHANQAKLLAKGLCLTGEPGAYFLAWN